MYTRSKVFNDFFRENVLSSEPTRLESKLPSPEVIHQGPNGPHTEDRKRVKLPPPSKGRNCRLSSLFSSFYSCKLSYSSRYRAMGIMWGGKHGRRAEYIKKFSAWRPLILYVGKPIHYFGTRSIFYRNLNLSRMV